MNRSNYSARPRRGNPTGSRLQGHPTLFTSEILPPFRRWSKAPRNSSEDIEVQSESVFRWPADTWHADCRQIVGGKGGDYFPCRGRRAPDVNAIPREGQHDES